MPRPTRRRAFLAPSAGLMVFSSMCFFLLGRSEHLHQVRDLLDHSAHRGRVLERRFAVGFSQAEAAHRRAMRLARAGDALDELDLDGLLVAGLSVHVYSPLS